MRHLALILFLIFSVLCPQAQTDEAYSWSDKGVWPESPKAATIREVTTPLPALLTGAAEFSVPLHTLVAEDFALPFQFSYHSNGIRIKDDPCPWGYGWTLSPTIRISRRIIGRPDGLFTPAGLNKDMLSHNECYHAMTDSLLDLSWGGPRHFPAFYTDPAPDIFTVQLPGKQFTVIFEKTATGYNAITAGCDEYRIETDDYLMWFRITDPKGIRYTFDVEGEYSVSPVYLTEWLPGSIELPSGNKITFSYIDCKSAIQNMSERVPKHYRFVINDPNPQPDGNLLLTHPDFKGGKHLSSVEFDGEKVSISYDGTHEGHRCIKSLVATIDGKEVRRASFTYDADRKMLQSIVTPEGEYSFEYDAHTFHEGSGRDWWGFSNGKGAGGSPSVNIDLSTLLANEFADIHYHGADRSTDAENMQARMLVKATYPTGGSVRWEYEPHRFDPIGPSTSAGYRISGFTSLSEGGGVRVKSISLYEHDSDDNPQTTTFFYGENRSGKAVCKAAPTPDTFIDCYKSVDLCQEILPNGEKIDNPFFRETWNVIIASESNYMQYRFGETPIWYDCVETVNEEGKTVTRFEDIIGDDDLYYSATDFTNWITESFHTFSDGPQMTSQTVYRSTALGGYSPVQKEIMEYETTESSICRGHHIKRLIQSSPQIESYPDFSGTDRTYYPEEGINYITSAPTGVSDAPPYGGNSFYYTHGTTGIYRREAFTMYSYRERLQSKTVTEYRDNGTYTTSQSIEYVPGTGLIAKTTDRVIPDRADTVERGAESMTRTLTYADSNAGGAEGAMAEANMTGIALKQTVQDNTARTTLRAQISRYGNSSTSRVFRPSRVYSLRGTDASVEYYAADFAWNARGKLLSKTDRAGIVTCYTWDSHSRYPVSMKTGTLTSTAEWEPGVGVKALTTPAGIRSVYTYDTAGRLASSGIAGHGTLVSWEYAISHSGANYVKETVWQNSASAAGAPYTRSNHDGLGRTVSEVTAWNSDGWKYTATGTDYDTMGRPCRQYSTTPVGTANPGIAEIGNAASEYYGDSKPYSTTTYEQSQRRLPQKTLKAGEAWHSGSHSASVRRLVNDGGAYSCASYTLGTDMRLTLTGSYAKGALTVEETVDEDGITEATFTDFRGRTVMRRRGSAKTYYVYNDYGDLCYILPPNMPERSYASNDAVLTEHAYIYRYDSRGRLVYSKIPGCDASESVYDNADRLVAETDADLGGKWRLHFYDSAGRQVLVTETTMQMDAARMASLAQPRTATRAGSASAGLKGYNVSFSFPADNRVTTAAYYDNYTLLPNISTDGAGYMSAPTGLQTGLWAATDDGGGVYSIFWYDSKGRKGYEITDTDRHRHLRAIRYTYAGQLSMEFERVYDKSTAVWKYWDAERKYGYDSAGRLEWETAASDSCTAVIRYTYDAAGRLSKTEKGLRKGDSCTEISSSVTRDYAYDVHGWKVKIVTGIPMKLARGAAETTDISTPYYGAASSDVIKTPGGVVVARTKYTETIHYADGAVPRYNGTPSARDLTQGGRYDYRYDTLDRLIAADYTPPSGKPDTDFSTEYTYDILSRPTSIKRHGVVDVDGTDEVFGLLDNLTLTYDGATLGAVKSIITDETGRDYYGRTGFAKGTYMASAPVEYNAAGRLVKDTGRMLSMVRYNTMGLPVLYSVSTDMSGNPPRQERSYDATGAKRRQTDYGAVRGQIAKTADRRYMESFTFNADTLERIEFNGGYFDGQGKAHFLFTDWQGNVTMTTDAGGRLEQHTGYYPYGEPWREPSGQHAKLFAGKERVTGLPGGDYDFGPRGYRATTTLWDSWDIHAADYAMWSPWMYCGGNPIKNIDPTGNIIEGKSKTDAAMVVEDFRNMFPGDEFKNFRELIVQSGKNNNGKTLAPISPDAISSALNGITLNEDQQTLVEMVVNTINSKDVHKIEYLDSKGNLSYSAEKVFAPLFDNPDLPTSTILKANGGFPVDFIENQGGGGLTTPIKNGTYSLVFKDSSFHLNGRSVTTGHEIIGHGRSLSLGRKNTQHVDAIQTENLILRVMGIPYINTGAEHAPNGAFLECSLLPSFR